MALLLQCAATSKPAGVVSGVAIAVGSVVVLAAFAVAAAQRMMYEDAVHWRNL